MRGCLQPSEASLAVVLQLAEVSSQWSQQNWSDSGKAGQLDERAQSSISLRFVCTHLAVYSWSFERPIPVTTEHQLVSGMNT